MARDAASGPTSNELSLVSGAAPLIVFRRMPSQDSVRGRNPTQTITVSLCWLADTRQVESGLSCREPASKADDEMAGTLDS